MAMVDYGAIGFKNGKLISTGFFTPMEDTVGWKDTEEDCYYTFDGHTESVAKPTKIDGNYFLCIGDKEHTVCFYKEYLTMFSLDTDFEHNFWRDDESFGTLSYRCDWSKWHEYIGSEQAIVKKRNGYFVFKWKYKGNKYKVYFGYGVDLDWYKKTHLVNYYRTCPKFLWRKFTDNIKDWFRNHFENTRYSDKWG